MIWKRMAWIVPMGWIGVLACGLFGQAAAKPSGNIPSAAQITRQIQQYLAARQSSDGQPAAEHLYKAWRQGRALETAHAGRPVRGASGSSTATWQELGPKPLLSPFYTVGSMTPVMKPVSGRVTAIAVDLKADPSGNTVYVGTAQGGLWVSTNGLAAKPVFTPLTDALPAADIGSIAIDDSTQPATIYVGTGDQDYQQDSNFGVGILKSTDGGKTWTTTSWADNGAHTFFGLSVDRIVIDPANPQHLVAATATAPPIPGYFLPPGAPYPETGIYASTDGGQTWTLAQQFTDIFGNLQNVNDLVVDPSTGTWFATVYGLGVYSSPDGKTWTAATPPFSEPGLRMDWSTFGRASLAVRNGTLYLLFSQRGNLPYYNPPNYTDTGIAQSTDGGKTWTTIAQPVPPSNPYTSSFFVGRGDSDQSIVAPPGSNGLILGGSYIAFTASVNGMSTTWTDVSGSEIAFGSAYAVAANGANGWYAGAYFGLWSTQDGGTTWANDNGGLGTDEVDSVMGSGSTSGVDLASNDNMVFRNGNDGTTTWVTSYDQLLGSGLDEDPANPARIYAGRGGSADTSDDGGKTFAQLSTDLPSLGGVPSDYSGLYLLSVIPGEPWNVAVSTCRIWIGSGYSTPVGAGWSPAGPDLTTDQPGTGCPQSSPSNPRPSVVTVEAPAPSDANTFYALTSNGRVEGTTNLFDKSPVWNNLTVAPLPTDGSVPFTAMAVDPSDAKTVYLGLGGYGSSHLFKSSDGGASWTDITGTLPDEPINSIAMDPETPSDIYVAMDTGVFVASDGGVSGENWQQMGSGLPAVPVLQIGFSKLGSRVLLAATRGRGVWSIAPLDSKPDFALHLSPDYSVLQQGQPVTLTATFDAINGYSGTVQLSCTAPSSGCSIAPASIQAGKSATVTLDATALPNGGTVSISATDGTLTHTQSAQVQTSGLIVTPSLLHLPLNSGAVEFPIVTGLNLSGKATLGCQNLPAGMTCSFGGTIDPGNTWTNLYISASSSVATGTYTIDVTATEGSQVLTTPVTVKVSTFVLSSSSSWTVVPDGTSPATFGISSQASYSNATPVTLSCTGSVQCRFNPATIQPYNGSSTLIVTNLGSLSQPLTFNVVGTSGNDQETIPLTVRSGTWSVTPELTNRVVQPGNNFADFTLDYTADPFLPQPVTTCNATGGVTCNVRGGYSTIDVQLSGLSQLPAGTDPYNFSAQVSVGDQQKTIPLTVTFATFNMGVKAATQQVLGGADQATFMIDTSAVNNSTTPIDLACTAPAGLACAASPATINPGQSSTVTVTGLTSTTPQNLTFHVTGSSGKVQESLALMVQLADFTLSSPTPTPTLASGGDTASFVIHAGNLNLMRGPIQLACSNPGPLTCAFTPANLVAGTSTTLQVSGLSKATPTNDQIPIAVTGTAGSDAHTLNLTVNVPDFSGTPTTSSGGSSGSGASQTITAGQTADFGLTYNSVNGFSGAVTMSCSGAPAKATCSVSPASFTLASGGSQKVTVAVATTGKSVAPAPVDGEPSLPIGLLALVGLLGLAGLALASLPRRQRLPLAVALAFSALLLAGCGGGGASPTPAPPAVQPTPSGTSTITVTATANGASHSNQLTLTVQ